MFQFFRKKRKRPENIKEILSSLIKIEKNIEKLSLDLENLKKESRFHLQRVGIVRYNPFSDVGGNQSFSIALLDSNDNGFVITSLYSKEGNRVYGKAIKKGESIYHLSQEEKEAIKKAKEKNERKNSKKPNNSSTNRSGFRSH
jgi:hypothetical protein